MSTLDERIAALQPAQSLDDRLAALQPANATATDSPPESLGSYFRETAQNVPGSALGVAKNVYQVVRHPIDTAKSLGNLALGAADELIPGKTVYSEADKQFDAVKQFYINRYGSLNAAKESFKKDPIGVIQDLSAALSGTGGIIGKAGELSDISALSKAGGLASKAGSAIEPVSNMAAIAKPVLQGAGKVVQGFSGLSTGVGIENIGENVKAGQTLDQPFMDKSFRKALSRDIGQSDIYKSAMDAVDKIRKQRSSEYLPALKKISENSEPMDIGSIQSELENQLKEFKISKNPDGSLNFDHSVFSADPEAKTVVKTVANKVMNWGKVPGEDNPLARDFSKLINPMGNPVDPEILRKAGFVEKLPPEKNFKIDPKYLTPEYVDVLKRVLQGEYSKSNMVRAFTTPIAESAQKLLSDNVPGYGKMTANYEAHTQTLNELGDALSLNGEATPDTAIRKLSSVLRQNFEYRKELLDELNKHSGMDLKAAIAGNQLSQWEPRGLNRQIGLISGLNFFNRVGGMVGKPLTIAGLASMSPRLVGEFLYYMGLPTNVVFGVLKHAVENPEQGQLLSQVGKISSQDKQQGE